MAKWKYIIHTYGLVRDIIVCIPVMHKNLSYGIWLLWSGNIHIYKPWINGHCTYQFSNTGICFLFVLCSNGTLHQWEYIPTGHAPTCNIWMGGNQITRGAESIKRCHLTSIGNPTVEKRWSYDRLISTMWFPILVRWDLYIEWGPREPQMVFWIHTINNNKITFVSGMSF